MHGGSRSGQLPYSVRPITLASTSQLLEAHPGPRMPFSLARTPPASLSSKASAGADWWTSASSEWRDWSAPSSGRRDWSAPSSGWGHWSAPASEWSDWSAWPDPSGDKWTATDSKASQAVSLAAEPEVETPANDDVKFVELVTFAEEIPWDPPKTSAYLIVKAKNLFDPTGSRHHTGGHPEHLQQMLQHQNLPGHFKTIKTWFRRMTSMQMPLSLGIWCKRGKHRSVGLATLVAHCLSKIEGCQVELTHKAAAEFNCGQGAACHECTGHKLCPLDVNKLRDECFCTAAEMWRRA